MNNNFLEADNGNTNILGQGGETATIDPDFDGDLTVSQAATLIKAMEHVKSFFLPR